MISQAFCVLAVSLIFSWVYSSVDGAKKQKDVDRFRKFENDFELKFENETERTHRFGIFKQNVRAIRALNKRGGGAKFGVNKYSHLTSKEFQAMVLMSKGRITPSKKSQRKLSRKKNTNSTGTPASFDWREKAAVTGVKDQGECGSCWAFASTAVVESQRAISGGGLGDLSEQELVSCDKSSYGCGGGYTTTALEFVKQNGLVPATSYPYSGTSGVCENSVVAGAGRVYVSKVDDLRGKSELELADYLAETGPFTFGFAVPAEMQHYVSGVFSSKACAQQINHAMTAVGYGSNEVPYWIVKNSWGSKWGDQGYILLERNVNLCSFLEAPISASITKQ